MDHRKTPNKRRRLSQRAVPVEQAEESMPVEQAQAVDTEQPVEQAQAAAELPLDEPIIGESVPLESILGVLVESLKHLAIKAEEASELLGKDFSVDVDYAEKKLAPLYEKCQRAREEGIEVPGAPSLNLNVSFTEDESARARLYREQVPHHFHFAERTFDYLLKCYGLRVPGNQGSDQYYEKFMGEAVLSLCILYRDQWREKFRSAHRTLMKLEYFVLYSCALPVERDSHYFYNYLLRVAVVFEMAVYCFDHNYDYFQIAQNCAGEFVDVLFFRDEGGWPGLKTAASVMATVTRPLRFVVNCPKQGTGSFADVIQRLEGYTSRGVINMTSRECSLLKEVNEQLLHGGPSAVEDYIRELLGANVKKPVPVLMSYFEYYLPEHYPISLDVLPPGGDDYWIDLDAWLYNGDEYEKAMRCYDAFQRGRVDETIYRFQIHALDSRIDDRNLEFALGIRHGETEARRPPQPDAASGSRPPPRHAPSKRTGAVPKVRTAGKPVHQGNYVRFDKRHVEGFVELYIPAMASFLHNFVCEYLAPRYGLSTSEDDDYFFIDSVYYEERKAALLIPESHKRMAAWHLPAREPAVLPIRVQRLLDTHAVLKPADKYIMYKEKRPVLAVPDVPESVTGRYPVWVIQGTLTKHGSSMGRAAETMDKFRGMLKTRHFRTSRVETDEETVQTFRLRTASETKIRMPEDAVARPLYQYLGRHAPSGRKKKHGRRSKK